MCDMKTVISLLITFTLACSAIAQSAKPKNLKEHNEAAQTRSPSQPAALTASGTGTQGHLAKWVTSSVLTDSGITEDKSGNVGIGAPAGSSALTVGGLIEMLAGGIKFPDGSIQTKAASLNHDDTLKGDGAGVPLGLAVPLIFAGSVENGNGGVKMTKFAAGGPPRICPRGSNQPCPSRGGRGGGRRGARPRARPRR